MGRLDHGVIGNGRMLALVSPTSAIEWFCAPRFDSPSVFARLLDARHGGTFRVLAGDEEVRGQSRYLTNTNVLVTRFERGDDAYEVVDFAPRFDEGPPSLELMRIVRPIRGTPRVRIDFDPRPDYARVEPQLTAGAHAIEVRPSSPPLELHATIPLSYVLAHQEIALRDPIAFSLHVGTRREAFSLVEAERALADTTRYWRTFAMTCALPGFADEAVLRSALCLKLHAYADTGAIIAAATTSIPEAMGTERTWDYRYCWLRDAAFVVEALRRLSYLREGAQFIVFLRDVAESGPLQPLYGVGGERSLPELFLPHLSGFEGNGHVRVGNAAAEQQQNDLMGELVLCLETLLRDPRLVLDDEQSYFPLVERLVEEAIALAPRPDTSIWEFRTMLRPYTFSRAMCWVAIARGAKVARRLGKRAQAERWAAIAEQERRIVLDRGFSASLGMFTQSLDGQHADASNLLLPTLGLLDARDPRFESTLVAYERELVRDGFVLRYKNLDDFGHTTSAFTICGFWWAEALALAGRLDDAVRVFSHLARHANPLGLFSEDVDPGTASLIGNFPQAYTHVGLVHAAVTIGTLRDAATGGVRAWVDRVA